MVRAQWMLGIILGKGATRIQMHTNTHTFGTPCSKRAWISHLYTFPIHRKRNTSWLNNWNGQHLQDGPPGTRHGDQVQGGLVSLLPPASQESNQREWGDGDHRWEATWVDAAQSRPWLSPHLAPAGCSTRQVRDPQRKTAAPVNRNPFHRSPSLQWLCRIDSRHPGTSWYQELFVSLKRGTDMQWLSCTLPICYCVHVYVCGHIYVCIYVCGAYIQMIPSSFTYLRFFHGYNISLNFIGLLGLFSPTSLWVYSQIL